MRILLKNGRIIDPAGSIDTIGNLLIEDGKIAGFPRSTISFEKMQDTVVIDATGKVIAPGFVDLHASLCEPGFEHRETISTGSLAAAAGGFTTVACTPNTDPVNDNASVTEYILFKARTEGSIGVLPLGAITKGGQGTTLAEIGEMKEAGCVGITDIPNPIMNARVMRLAMSYARAFDIPVLTDCRDTNLSGGGVMNEGYLSTILGLRGDPAASEEIMVSRNIAIAALTESRVHISHVSTREAVRLIRDAKKRGIQVTADVAPHHFTLTESAVSGYDTCSKVMPPLRTEADVEALIEGLREGTIEAISSDHTPVSEDEKKVEFDLAPFGISSLETCLSLSLSLVRMEALTLSQMIEKLTVAPSRILGIDRGTLRVGAVADVTVFDDKETYKVDRDLFYSKGKNTPFHGFTLIGKVLWTIANGRIVYADKRVSLPAFEG